VGDRIAQESLLSDLNEIKIKNERKTIKCFIYWIALALFHISCHIAIWGGVTSLCCLYRRLCV
jgi:hypothetical protein